MNRGVFWCQAGPCLAITFKGNLQRPAGLPHKPWAVQDGNAKRGLELLALLYVQYRLLSTILATMNEHHVEV